jgi:hypothetical protein
MKLSMIALLGLLVLGIAGCSLSEKQAQNPNPCQSGEATDCLGTPDHLGGGQGNRGNGGGSGGGGMGGGM